MSVSSLIDANNGGSDGGFQQGQVRCHFQVRLAIQNNADLKSTAACEKLTPSTINCAPSEAFMDNGVITRPSDSSVWQLPTCHYTGEKHDIGKGQRHAQSPITEQSTEAMH